MLSDILITGSEGLVGSALRRALEARGQRVRRLDLRAADPIARGDVQNGSDVQRCVAGCRGIVHLAAVSRVLWAERDPGRCHATNVGGTSTVINAALSQSTRPWLLFASSREVYGQPATLPVSEEAELKPLNVYGRSKLGAERMLGAARDAGLRVAVVRLSNVYGSTADHADRVVPAFARAAVSGTSLRVDCHGHTFDFTHVDDTVRGLLALVELLDNESAPPPIHLVTGTPTTLGEAAELAVELASSDARIVSAEPRSYDVSRFYGDPTRARQLLGWTARVKFREGLSALIAGFQAEQASPTKEVAS